MTAAPKYGSLWKLHSRDTPVRRAPFPVREAGALEEELGESTRGGRRGMGPSAYARGVGIMSGRASSQQGLATTCKDPATDGTTVGAGRDEVWRMSPYERRRRGNALRGDPREVALRSVTLVSGKGALGTRRFGVPRRIRTLSRKKCGLGHGTKAQVNQVVWGRT
jgi:hypothetical protein